MRRTPSLVALVALVFATGIAQILLDQAVRADAVSDASQFVADTNAARASRGLPALSVDGSLLNLAQSWSSHMAAVGYISHNPSLSSYSAEPWLKLGENVGTGPSVSAIQQAFLNSPMHYRNIVDPGFTRIGVAVVYGNHNAIFVTLDFLEPPVAAESPIGLAPRESSAPAPVAAPRQSAAIAPRPALRPATASTTSVPSTTQPSNPRLHVPAIDLQDAVYLSGVQGPAHPRHPHGRGYLWELATSLEIATGAVLVALRVRAIATRRWRIPSAPGAMVISPSQVDAKTHDQDEVPQVRPFADSVPVP